MKAEESLAENLKIEAFQVDDPAYVERVAYRISSANPVPGARPALVVNIFDNADNLYFQQVQLRWGIGFDSDSQYELSSLLGAQLGNALVVAAHIIQELDTTGQWSGEMPLVLVG